MESANSRCAVVWGGGRALVVEVGFSGRRETVGSGGGWAFEAEATAEVVMGGFVEEFLGTAVEAEAEPRWLARGVTRVGWESKFGVEDATEVGTEEGAWLSESEAAGSCGAVGGDRFMVFSSQPRCSPKLLRVMRSN